MKKTVNIDVLYFIIGLSIILITFIVVYYPRTPDSTEITGIHNLAVLEDKTAHLDIEDIKILHDLFIPQKSSRLFERHSSSAYWLRFTIPVSFLKENSFLEIDAPSCEHITIFFPNSEPIIVGKKIPIKDIPLKTRFPQIPIPARLSPQDQIFIRIHTSTIYRIPLKIITTKTLITKLVNENIIFGVFFGALLAVFIVNLFSLLIVKNKIFLLYVLYLISLMSYHFRVHGFLYFLGPSFKTYETILWLSLGGTGIFMILFAQAFLRLKSRYPLIHKSLSVFIILFGLQTIVGVFFSSLIANKIAYITGFLVPIVIIITTAYDYLKGNKDVRFYLLAWAALFSATLIWSSAAYFEAQLITNYVFIGGSTIDSLLFTLAIFDKIRKDLREKELLEAKEAYYLEMARTDPLTGLYNRRHLENEIYRLYREEEIFTNNALLIIDLDNFRELNEQYGHLSGDKILIKIGNKILKKIRKNDLACRYGGDEFIVFLYNTNLETAIDIAHKIRDEIYQEKIVLEKGESIQISASIGVSECRKDDSFEGLFLRADTALFQAKKQGPNNIKSL